MKWATALHLLPVRHAAERTCKWHCTWFETGFSPLGPYDLLAALLVFSTADGQGPTTGWYGMEQLDGPHTCSLNLWGDHYGLGCFVLQWWNWVLKQLPDFPQRGNLACLRFCHKWIDFILCLCTSSNQIGTLIQNQPSRKKLIFLPILFYSSPGFSNLFFFSVTRPSFA